MPNIEHGESPPKEATYKFFFYGTLKKNEPNNFHLQRFNIKFLGEAVTVDKYPLIIATDFNIPFLLDKKGLGHNVIGEIYLGDQDAKDFLDEFEGIHDNIYSVKTIEVKDQKTGVIHLVDVYVLQNFKEDLIGQEQIFFESYSSKNNYYEPYRIKEDRPENCGFIYKQIKDF